eukprot:COSAG01_NODE_188_length_22632_cov_15.284915_19_plen_76_part_00
MPVVNEWSAKFWDELRADRAYDDSALELEALLDRDYLEGRSDWGISAYITRAHSLSPTSSPAGTAAPAAASQQIE